MGEWARDVFFTWNMCMNMVEVLTYWYFNNFRSSKEGNPETFRGHGRSLSWNSDISTKNYLFNMMIVYKSAIFYLQFNTMFSFINVILVIKLCLITRYVCFARAVIALHRDYSRIHFVHSILHKFTCTYTWIQMVIIPCYLGKIW